MANDLLNAVSDLDLPPSQKAVLIALANRTGKTTRICFPSIARICKDTSLSRRTVFYALRALESAGLLLRIGKPGNRSKYRVLVEPMTQIQRSAPVQALHPPRATDALPVRNSSTQTSINPIEPSEMIEPHEVAAPRPSPKVEQTVEADWVFTPEQMALIKGYEKIGQPEMAEQCRMRFKRVLSSSMSVGQSDNIH